MSAWPAADCDLRSHAILLRKCPLLGFYRRKLATGKSPTEAIRCLKRRLSDTVYKQLIHDAKAAPTPALLT